MTRRRHVLVFAATTLLGGCAGVSPTLFCERGYDVSADPFDAERYAVRSTDGESETARESEETTAARYRVDDETMSRDALRAHLRERYLVTLDDLTAAETAVLDGATAGGYDGCGDDEGVEALRARLSSARRLPPGYFLVAYEGTWYELSISLWVR